MTKAYKIAVIPGDGTGPEVLREGMKVMDVAAKKHDFKLDYTNFDFGGERYLKAGKILDDSEVAEMKNYDAIYLGAIGHPDTARVKPGLLEKGILLKLRFDLDQYINLRPVKLYPGVKTPLADKKSEDIDFVVVRENCAGLYKGEGDLLHEGTPDEETFQVMRYKQKEIDRCLRFAFDYCKNKRSPRPWKGLSEKDLDEGKIGQLTNVHKANVLTFCSKHWQRRFAEISKEYPEIKTNENYVDACCMWFVKNPESYDVVVTENMFGDIITDLGAIIQGGMGIAAGGNLNPEGVSMFEPMGGSAPKYTGKNCINPMAAILAGQIMLDYLGEKEASRTVENALEHLLVAKDSGFLGLGIFRKKLIKGLSVKEIQESGFSTSKIGDWMANYIAG